MKERIIATTLKGRFEFLRLGLHVLLFPRDLYEIRFDNESLYVRGSTLLDAGRLIAQGCIHVVIGKCLIETAEEKP